MDTLIEMRNAKWCLQREIWRRANRNIKNKTSLSFYRTIHFVTDYSYISYTHIRISTHTRIHRTNTHTITFINSHLWMDLREKDSQWRLILQHKAIERTEHPSSILISYQFKIFHISCSVFVIVFQNSTKIIQCLMTDT